MVESQRDAGEQSARRRLDFTFDINMAGPPQKGEREYITEEQVRHVWYQQPLPAHLLKKYEYQYRQRR
jgi:hypothetical protein